MAQRLLVLSHNTIHGTFASEGEAVNKLTPQACLELSEV